MPVLLLIQHSLLKKNPDKVGHYFKAVCIQRGAYKAPFKPRNFDLVLQACRIFDHILIVWIVQSVALRTKLHAAWFEFSSSQTLRV